MSQEKSKTVGDDEDGSGNSNSNPFTVFQQMESLNEKLKLLNYEKEFCRSNHQKPISRHYFAIPTNPGEQFHSFTALAAWLIVKANDKIDTPQEYDDPNATISTILDSVRKLGYTIEFSPSKLKSGCGEYCIHVLNVLADTNLQIHNIKFLSPKYLDENDENEIIDIEKSDLSRSEIDNTNEEDEDNDNTVEWTGLSIGGHLKSDTHFTIDEIGNNHDQNDDDDDEEEDLMDLEGLNLRSNQLKSQSMQNDSLLSEKNLCNSDNKIIGNNYNGLTDNNERLILDNKDVLESKTDLADWQLEIERVLPQLRIQIRNDHKDWRTHLDQMKHYKTEIETTFVDAKSQLKRLNDELSRAVDKITSREKYMNNQLEPLLMEYRLTQDNLNETTAKYRQASGGITNRSRTLAEITEELERVKSEMDERGSSMTDGSPVVRIKQAIQRLKSEMVAMDIRTGVLEHILLRIHLRVREDSQKPLFSKSYDLNGGNAFVY